MHDTGTWFITKNLQPRRPLLTDTGIADEIASTFRFSVREGRIALAAFCVMPDHWHALFGLSDLSLPRVMQLMDSWVGRESATVLEHHKVVWQDGYYDTRVVSGRQFSHLCGYIEANPLRAGLVKSAAEWRWSSAHSGSRDMVHRPWPWQFERDTG